MAGTGTAHLRDSDQALLRVEDLVVEFPVGRTGDKVHAVSGVSVDMLPGETLGLVGESGCGKSTTGRAVMQLPPPVSGSVRFDGVELTALHGEELRRMRPRLQMIFQDPISSLNPRRRVRDIVREGLDIWQLGDKPARDDKVDEVLTAVGMDPAAGDRHPHEFSGGQCQRISIARAVVTEPKLIICDEPVSALDVSVQAQILNLLKDLQRDFGLTYVFIAHDLNVVRHISDRVMVMYLGQVVEHAYRDELYTAPKHPYTGALLSAVPVPDPEIGRNRKRIVLEGDVPSPINPPNACRFHPRCPRFVEGRCDVEEPELVNRGGPSTHVAKCHYPLERWPLSEEDMRRAPAGV